MAVSDWGLAVGFCIRGAKSQRLNTKGYNREWKIKKFVESGMMNGKKEGV